MFYDYDEKYWPFLDKSSTEITAIIANTRQLSKAPMYKDFYMQ